MVKWMGRRVRGVSTSLISSVSLARNHWSQWGPDTAERKVRGEPDRFRFRRGAEEEEETEEEGEMVDGGNHLAVSEGFGWG